MSGLSAVIICRDEHQDVERSIRAMSFADEVLVIDAGPAERALEVPGWFGARVLKHAFDGDGSVKRWAVAETLHEWVLCLEADEEVTPELAESIRTLLARGEPSHVAYRFRFVTTFMGRPLRHGGDSSRHQIRLFDRRRAEWISAPLLAEVVPSGTVGELRGVILRHAVRDLSDSIAQMDANSSLAALDLAMSGRRPSGLAIVMTATFQFLRHYVLAQSFRDGFPGLAWSFMRAVGSAMNYMKARELMTGSRSEPGPRNAGGTGRLPRPPTPPETEPAERDPSSEWPPGEDDLGRASRSPPHQPGAIGDDDPRWL
jgi:hypothetical protein